jgi:error-prone DNA polymerase
MFALPPYAELHCLTNFSFLRGASHAEELIERAHALGYSAIAITDECSVAGIVRAHVAAKKCREDDKKKKENSTNEHKQIVEGIKLIVGTEVKLADGPRLVLLATDRASYGRMCALVTKGRMRAPKGEYRLEWCDLDDGLAGCLVLVVPDGKSDLEHARAAAARFAGRVWLAVELVSGPNDGAKLAALREVSSAAGVPLVAAGDIHMHLRSRRPLQDVMTAIRLGVPVHAAGVALHPNAERHLRLRAHLA